MVFFPFHPPVLKPDFDLPFREAKGVSDLDASPPGQVPVIVKLLFQLQNLLPRVGCPGALGFASIVIGIHWKGGERGVKKKIEGGECGGE